HPPRSSSPPPKFPPTCLYRLTSPDPAGHDSAEPVQRSPRQRSPSAHAVRSKTLPRRTESHVLPALLCEAQRYSAPTSPKAALSPNCCGRGLISRPHLLFYFWMNRPPDDSDDDSRCLRGTHVQLGFHHDRAAPSNASSGLSCGR